MLDEIRQNGKTVLSGEDGFSTPMFFNNLCGKNFSGEKYRDYIKYIAFGEMGFKPGGIMPVSYTHLTLPTKLEV